MIKLAILFLVIATVAGIFAFTDIAAAAPGIAQILFYAFLVLFVITLVVCGCWYATDRGIKRPDL